MRLTSRFAAIAALFLLLFGARGAADSLAAAPRERPMPSAVGRDIAVGLSALVTAIATFLGINAWRRRLLGANEYKIAFKTLEAVFALRESIYEARNRSAVSPERPLHLTEPAEGEEAEALLAARTYQERLAKVGAARESLLRAQQEALALWGAPAEDSLTDIHEVVRDLYSTSERFFNVELDRVRRAHGNGKGDEPDPETLAMKRVLYSIPDAKGKDPFGERIARAVARAEEFYRGRLR